MFLTSCVETAKKNSGSDGERNRKTDWRTRSRKVKTRQNFGIISSCDIILFDSFQEHGTDQQIEALQYVAHLGLGLQKFNKMAQQLGTVTIVAIVVVAVIPITTGVLIADEHARVLHDCFSDPGNPLVFVAIRHST